MKTKLIPSCEDLIKEYNNLSPTELLIRQLKWAVDPVAFYEDPLGGNMQLWDSQKEILRGFYGISKDGKRLKSEMIFLAGRRGGKTTIAALVSLYEASRMLMMKNPQAFYKLSPNAEIMCINVAPSEQQSLETVFKREKEIMANSPFFCSQNPDLTYNTIRFPKSVTIKALGSNVSSGVGRTVKSFVADEVSSFKDTEKHSPEELYMKLGNSTGTFKKWNENVRVAISSKTGTGDFLSNLHDRAIDENWEWAYCIKKKTAELNPEMDEETMEDERKRNPELFALEYELEDMEDVKKFFNEIKLKQVEKQCIKTNLFLGNPPMKRIDRVKGFVPTVDKDKLDMRRYPNALDFFVLTDPAIKNDAFGLSVGYVDTAGDIHIIGSTVIIAKRGGEISTEDVKNLLKPIFEAFPIRAYIFDIYIHSELQTFARQYNIECIQHTLNLNDWILTRNDLYDGRAVVPFVNYLFKELNELLIIRGTKIDHPSSGSKDMADTAAQLISHVRREEEEARLSRVAPTTHFMATF